MLHYSNLLLTSPHDVVNNDAVVQRVAGIQSPPSNECLDHRLLNLCLAQWLV